MLATLNFHLTEQAGFCRLKIKPSSRAFKRNQGLVSDSDHNNEEDSDEYDDDDDDDDDDYSKIAREDKGDREGIRHTHPIP